MGGLGWLGGFVGWCGLVKLVSGLGWVGRWVSGWVGRLCLQDRRIR